MNGKKRLNPTRKRWIASLIAGMIAVLIVCSGLVTELNHLIIDKMYQTPMGPDDRITVIGIDGESLDTYGAWPWSRDVMASVLNTLNEDPEKAPSAIGVDVLFSGTTTENADNALLEAASYGNVAVACSGVFETQMAKTVEGHEYLDDFTIGQYNMPFSALLETSKVGHINAMYDEDGILRHHLWELPSDNEDEKIESLPYVLYKMYQDYWQMEEEPLPTRNARGFWWVDYQGAPGDYYAYSVKDILTHQYDPDYLAGNIVLIGPYDSGLQDDYTTAADRAERMYGVEYMANVLDDLLNRNYKTEFKPGIQLGILFIMAVLMTYCWTGRKVIWSLLLSLASIGVITALCWLCYQYGRILNPVWFVLGGIISFLVAVGFHYIDSVQERRYISRTFERYVDPSVIKELVREDQSDLGLCGKMVDIAVLFVDIRGFTTMSESLPPDKVVAILNRYLNLTSQCVLDNHGTLDKYVGDCTMAIWGAPMACEDPIYHACRAAMDMVEGSAELSRTLEKEFGRKVEFGVGVHYGPAVVGNIGSIRRMDYTAIGDTVNTAARLEANAPAGTVYISRVVADALAERGTVSSLETPIRLKGKAEGFEVLKLERLQ